MRENIFKKIIGTIKDSVFPNICLCGKWGEPLCDSCRSLIKPYKTELCPICRKVSENGQTCKSCRGKSYLTGLMIYGKHKDVLKQVIWQYKYNFIKDLSCPLGEILTEKYERLLTTKNFKVTYVPISKQRLNWRGYNQSKLLAEKVAESLGLELIDILEKEDDISPQVGLKRKDRLKNIQNKIFLKREEKYSGRVLIIDDVTTTGATLEECAKMLRKAGFREVWGLALSRE